MRLKNSRLEISSSSQQTRRLGKITEFEKDKVISRNPKKD
jgi:hypothetical protein